MPRDVLRTCRGCGCTDEDACIDDRGQPCSWVLLDLRSPSGVCSVCAETVDWDMRHLACMGFAAATKRKPSMPDTYERVRAIIAKTTGLDPEHVTLTMAFSDAIHRGRAIEIRQACEIEFKIRLAEYAHIGWTCPADIVRSIETEISYRARQVA